MPIYEYKCEDHGVFEMVKPMSESGSGQICIICGETAKRVFSLFEMNGALPTRGKKMGETRSELFKNMAAEGIANKDWKEAEARNAEQIITAREKIS